MLLGILPLYDNLIKGVSMSAVLSSIQNSYTQNFPAEVPTKAAQGFLATAVINLIFGNAIPVALLRGTIAVTATVIEAVTRPIIKGIFTEYPTVVGVIQIMVPRALALGLATTLAPWIGLTYRTSSFIITFIAWMQLNQDTFARNVGMVEVF